MKKVKGLRWWMISMIALATVINYIDRNALAVMWPSISKDLNLSKDQYPIILTFFMAAYAISQTVSGKIYDWVGTKIGFVISIVIWAVSSGLHGLSRGLMTFSVLRATLGFGEAGNWPGAAKSNAEWFPVKERALAQGIFNSGASLGAVISAPLIALLYSLLGWKMTFPVIACFGIIWLIPWMFFHRGLPKTHPWITDEERDYIIEGQKQLKTSSSVKASSEEERIPGWGELLTYKQTYSIVIPRLFLDPIWWLFVSWLPIYLSEKFNFDVKQIGLFAWVPYVGAAAGSIAGGWISGYFINKGWTVNKARKTAILIGGIITFFPLIISAYASTPLSAVLLIAMILFGFQFSMNNIQTLPSDYLTGKSVGSLSGLGGTAAALGTIVTMWFVPMLTKTSWMAFFFLGASLVPIGTAALFVFSGQIKRIELKKKGVPQVKVEEKEMAE